VGLSGAWKGFKIKKRTTKQKLAGKKQKVSQAEIHDIQAGE
jgi:hypothetical protein